MQTESIVTIDKREKSRDFQFCQEGTYEYKIELGLHRLMEAAMGKLYDGHV